MSQQVAILVCGWMFCAAGWLTSGLAALLLFSIACLCFIGSVFIKS